MDSVKSTAKQFLKDPTLLGAKHLTDVIRENDGGGISADSAAQLCAVVDKLEAKTDPKVELPRAFLASVERALPPESSFDWVKTSSGDRYIPAANVKISSQQLEEGLGLLSEGPSFQSWASSYELSSDVAEVLRADWRANLYLVEEQPRHGWESPVYEWSPWGREAFEEFLPHALENPEILDGKSVAEVLTDMAENHTKRVIASWEQVTGRNFKVEAALARAKAAAKKPD